MSRAWLLAGAAVALCAAPSVADAQAWIQPAGAGYVNVGYRVLVADEFYGADGEVEPIASYRQHALDLYAQVGIVDRWLMAVLDGELLRRNVLVDQGAVTGLGDLRLGLWSGLVEAPFRLSLGVQLGLPTGDATPDADALDPFAQLTARTLPTGDGEWDVTFRLAAGESLSLGPRLEGWTTGQLGYAVRTSGFVDQIVYAAEVGLRPRRGEWTRLYALVRFTGAELLGDARVSQGVAGVGDGISFTAAGAELGVRLVGTLTLAVAVDGAFRATNLPRGLATKVALSAAWPPP